ncbi:hypothetical protein EA796_12330 [Pseudomonas sp. AOB-7]|nr:hypothetical protein EA796_12330 [Pseudomonas sp. AOB-7]
MSILTGLAREAVFNAGLPTQVVFQQPANAGRSAPGHESRRSGRARQSRPGHAPGCDPAGSACRGWCGS